MKRLFIFITLLTSLFSISSAQQAVTLSTASAAYCPYTFTRDLKSGSVGPDVKVLQQILNSDQRTVVAASGIASPGNETESYGVATREAVKKFQALFIEYIGVANGVFGPKTRTVMNAVCNGEYYTSGKGQVYSSVSTQNTVNNNANTAVVSTSTVDTVAPAIYLRSNSTAIAQGLSFRIIVTASEPIQAFTPESIIIEGGSVGDIRKLSPNSYSLLVTPNPEAKSVVAQVEADRVLDLAGNKNDNASNEIRIVVTQIVSTATTSTTTATVTSGITSGELDNIFNRILAQVTPSTTTTQQPTSCTNGATNPPYCNNQYNNQPNYNNGSNSGQNQQNSLMNMLLLSKLLGGNNSGGGLFGNLFGGNKSSQPNSANGNTSGSGSGSGGTGGTGAADIQACANGDKTKCGSGTPTDAPLPPKRPEEANFMGGKVEKIYTCAAEAPALSGETSQLRNHTNKTSVFLKVIATDNKANTIIRYGKDLDASQDAEKRMADNACYKDSNVSKRSEQLICCKEVQYNATGQRYTCVPHPELGQTKATYYFPTKVDFSAKNCSVGQTSTTATPTAQSASADQKCYVSSMQWNPQTQKCEPINYNQPLTQSSNGQNTSNTSPSSTQDPMNPSSYPQTSQNTVSGENCDLRWTIRGYNTNGCTDKQISDWCNSFTPSERQIQRYGSNAGRTGLDVRYPVCIGKYTIIPAGASI